MDKLYVGVFGSGLGHAVRMMAVASHFRSEGCSVRFCSSGEVTSYLSKAGFPCNTVPDVDVVYSDDGSFSATATAQVTPVLLFKFIEQISAEVRHIRQFGPQAVLSDSVLSTIIAARLLGKRSVVVLNQLKLISSPETPHLAGELISTGSIGFGDALWGLSDEILFPDLPPPFTISERALWGAGEASRRGKYIGFLLPQPDTRSDKLVEGLKNEKRTKIFWQISGPPKTRPPMLAKALSLASSLGDSYVSVISAGNPRGDGIPTAVPGGYLYDWCPVKDELLKASDVVVSRAGHTSLAQFITCGKPTLLVPIVSQSEQEGNAAKAEHLGISVKTSESDLDRPALLQALAALQGDGLRKRVEEMSRLAMRYDAIGSIAAELCG